MFKIEIRSAQNGKIVKTKFYQTQKSLDIWLPKMSKRWARYNNIIVFKHLGNGWESIPTLNIQAREV